MANMRNPSEYRKCRICGVKVKIWNLENHFENVHPREVNRLRILKPISGKCVVCEEGVGKSDLVCGKHRIEILPRFLVGKALSPLREYVHKTIQKSANECTHYFLQFFPTSIYAEVGTDIEKIGYEELALHSNKSVFLSYVLLRLCQIIPSVAERAYELARSPSGYGQLRTRYDTEFMEALLSEFEFFLALYYGVQGLYNVATDSVDRPSKVVIVPEETEEAVLKMLMLRIMDSESVYRCSLYPIVHKSSVECLYNGSGAFFCYPREEITKNFDTFKKIWLNMFGSKMPLDESEYFDFVWYFKWIVCPFGFTRQNKSKARFLDDYEGLDEDELFLLLDTIIPDVCSKVGLISSKQLGTKDPNHRVLIGLNRLSWAFKFSSSGGNSYFLPVIEWLHNLLSSLLVQFGRTLNATGPFFEDWINNAVEAFASGLLGFQFTKEFGYVPTRRRKIKKEAVTDWRILEKNLKIKVEEETDVGKTLKLGEIDLVVYANYNIYLLELKSANLSGKKAVKYLNKKAAVQCSKYASWARKQENIKWLLARHRIPEHQVNSIRILCCTNGVYNKTAVTDTKTGERFAVIPLFLLLNLFAGAFTVAIRDVFPFLITGISNGLKFAFPSLHEAYLVDNRERLSETANRIVQDWYAMMTFDRRQDFKNFKKKKPHAFTLARFYAYREVYIGNTSNWILAKPLLLGTEDHVHYYVGTQIGEAGTTLFCSSCKSAIKYYYSPDEEKNLTLNEVLDQKACPFCRRSMKTASDYPDIISNMSFFVLDLKNKVDSRMLDPSR
jgi:hypothetical protein